MRLAARDFVTDPGAQSDRVGEAASALSALLKKTRLELAPEQQDMIDGVSARLQSYRDGIERVTMLIARRSELITALPPLQGLLDSGTQIPGLDPAMFKGKVSVVNVWASWCVPCHDEARLLTELGKDKRLQMVGINYKDTPENARRFLGRYGNPFGIVGVDGNGRAAIEWGVYGVPETFVVGRNGTIVYKMVGPIMPDNIDSVLRVEIDKALNAGS